MLRFSEGQNPKVMRSIADSETVPHDAVSIDIKCADLGAAIEEDDAKKMIAVDGWRRKVETIDHLIAGLVYFNRPSCLNAVLKSDVTIDADEPGPEGKHAVHARRPTRPHGRRAYFPTA